MVKCECSAEGPCGGILADAMVSKKEFPSMSNENGMPNIETQGLGKTVQSITVCRLAVHSSSRAN
jgi:hypothetical protein